MKNFKEALCSWETIQEYGFELRDSMLFREMVKGDIELFYYGDELCEIRIGGEDLAKTHEYLEDRCCDMLIHLLTDEAVAYLYERTMAQPSE